MQKDGRKEGGVVTTLGGGCCDGGVEMGATLIGDGCAGLRSGIFLAVLVKSDTLSSSSLAGQSLQCVKESPITHNILTESEFMFTGIYSFSPFT